MRANEFIVETDLGLLEGKKFHKLNLESIEKRFGEIHLGGGTTLKNQKLINFLHKANQPEKVYEYILVQKLAKLNGSTLNESIDSTDENLNHLFDRFNSCSSGNKVKVGDDIAVLELEAMHIGNAYSIELSGFLNPKEVVAADNRYIKVISGETYPRIKIEQLSMWRQVIFFDSKENAEKCLTYMSLLSGKLGDWDLSINVQQDATEGLEEGWKEKAKGLAAAGAIAFAGQAIMPKTIEPSPYSASDYQLPRVPQEILQKVNAAIHTPLALALRREAFVAGIEGAELAQLIAQCAHETQDFMSLVEHGGSLDFRQYDIRYNPQKAKLLGNTQPGDGARYHGRGFIQLTGRYNYKKAGEALGLPLEARPELLERPDVAAKVAVWYWQHRVAPKVDNFKDTRAVTKPINSGLQGLADREKKFNAVMQILSTPVTR